MKFKQRVESAQKSEDFVRIKDKESIIGVLRGEPIDFYSHWNDKFSEPCPGRATCELCKAGSKGKFQFRLNIVIEENGVCVAKILELGRSVYDMLSALSADYDLERTKIKISRKGSTRDDTEYAVIPVPRGEVDDILNAKLEAVQLHDLSVESAPF